MSQLPDSLAEQITFRSSRQTYFTIKLLVERPLVADCYKAYAYLRWLDDQIDIEITTSTARKQFIKRQISLVDKTYKGEDISSAIPEEQLLISLIKNDSRKNYRLESFIRNFLAIIEFDAGRKNKRITTKQLQWYTATLGKAVTDGIEYFVDNATDYPDSKYHYSAAIAAHTTHILRDFKADMQLGFYNLPKGKTETEWVKEMVEDAHKNFNNGKKYINSLSNFKIKLVALLYCARFEWLLKNIAEDNYKLRKQYFHKTHYVKLFNFLMIFITLSFNHLFRS